MLNETYVFNTIMVLPPEERKAISDMLQCGEEPLTPEPECEEYDPKSADFFCYVVGDIQYHNDFDSALVFYLDHLDNNIRSWNWEGAALDPVDTKERLVAAFHAVQQDMLRLGWDGDYHQEPSVFHLPCLEDDSLKVGFIWKQHRHGLTFIASPMPLPWLGEAVIKKGDKR